ncbi:MAG: thiolase family protein [Aigarchaeota archaeon]|nr:thiolase family protein [Candidatus Pelearchaeum maunauluense]
MSRASREVWIVGYARTPIGKFLKSLADVEAPKLGAIAIKAALERSGVEPGQVDEVIMGNVIQAGIGQNPARQAAYYAGIPPQVDGYTVNKVCASGMKAISNAASAIISGDAEIVVAGGMESMSRAPFLLTPDIRSGVKLLYEAGPPLIDSMTRDGLVNFHDGKSMIEIAERIARAKGVTRREADEFSLNSHLKAYRATTSGYFNEEITPVDILVGSRRVRLEHDEGIRPDTTLEKLSQLPPAIRGGEIITAGNSPQLSDGAAALVLASDKAVSEYGLKPLARILGYTWAGLDIENFPEAPIPATRKLLRKLDMRIGDFDLFEHNEAFAVSSIIVARTLGIPFEKLNIYGGAIALGHPLGASGARIVMTLVNALRRNKLSRGLATICHGGGGAMSLALEA